MLICDYCQSAMAISNWEGKMIYVNRAFLKLWGFSNIQQVRGVSVLSFWQDKDQAREAMQAIKIHGSWRGILTAYTNKDSERYIRVYASHLKRKGRRKQYMIASFLDVTDVYLHRERFNDLVLASSNWIFESDKEGLITYVSEGIKTHLGYDPDEVAKKSILEIVSEKDRAKTSKIKQDLLQRPRRAMDIQLQVVSNHGLLKDITISVIPIFDHASIFKGFRGVCRDIGRQKELERTLENKNLKLEEKNKQLNELNSALKVLIAKQQEYIEEVKNNLTDKIIHSVLPHIDTIENSIDDPKLIEATRMIKDSIASFNMPSNQNLLKIFNPKELKIIDYILHGKTSKEIATALNLSTRTIQFHRERIREKLNLKHSNENLREKLADLFYGDNSADFN